MSAKRHLTGEPDALKRVLRQAREDVGLTQVELADRLDKPQSYVAKNEKGKRRVDVIEFLHIARALKTDPCVLLRQIK